MDIYTIEQVADILGVSPKHVRDLIDSGRLQAFNVGVGGKRSHWRVTREALNKFIEVSA